MARCHLSPNEARTSGISVVNDPLTAEQIQLSPFFFLNRHQVHYRRRVEGEQARDRAGKERLMGEAVSQKDEGCSER